jgi:diguanylate cyclase (GGDEF)-like protein
VSERILVVDDDPDVARFVEVTLQRAGFEIHLASDGEEALHKVAEVDPDLVVLDVMMPKIDGFGVAHHIRRSARRAGVGIIMLTARGHPEDEVRGLALGADDYIVKPFDPALLVARVRTALGRARTMLNTQSRTRMPGSVVIEEGVAAMIRDGTPFALLCCDLDHFRAFNDAKGWDRGNELIEALGEVVDEGVAQFAGDDGRAGHAGGAEFLAIVPPDVAEDVARYVCEHFDKRAAMFYPPEELQAGHVVARDRSGGMREVPLVSVSVGIATSRRRDFGHYGEAVSVATEMQRFTKQDPGSTFAIDRRSRPSD